MHIGKVVLPVFAGRPLCALGLLALAAFSPVAAQSGRRTTLGLLLAGRTDTIEVERSSDGERGATRAHLRLTRTDSGFVGLLRLSVYRVDPSVSVGHTPEAPQCDTAMISFMPLAVAERLRALVDSTVIAVGAPPARRYAVRDIRRHDTFRLSGRTGAVVVRDARTVEHREILYHVPLETAGTDRRSARNPFGETQTPLTEARHLLDANMRREQLEVFSRECRQK
jgi:hypothetical protein